MTLRVPDVVANAAAACGADRWLRDLPRLVADLEAEWSVSVERPYPHASEAFVAEASLGDGTPAVLKLLIPHDVGDARHEITMLELAGAGAASACCVPAARTHAGQFDVSPFPEILRAQRRHLAQLRHHPWQDVETTISAATRAIYQALRDGAWIPGQRQRL